MSNVREDPLPNEMRTERRAMPEHEVDRSRWWLALGIALAAGIGIAAYLWFTRDVAPPAPLPRVEAPAAAPVGPLDEQAVVEHPLAEAPAGTAPLPALADSDALLVPALIELAGNPRIQDLLQLPGVARRLVVTIDNLPRDKVTAANLPFKPVTGSLRVSGIGDSLALDPANSARYATYVKLFESVDMQKLVALYVRTYPLFQESYAELGYPKRYFNDRLLQVIDHLLATPAPAGRILLTQPKLMYEFADPALQSLTPGQKMLIRMGPDNAARVKTRLQALRDEVLRNSEKR